MNKRCSSQYSPVGLGSYFLIRRDLPSESTKGEKEDIYAE